MLDGSGYAQHQSDIFANYLLYTKDTEPPVHYHRWCWLTSLGARIGRSAYLSPGHGRIFPNLYVMLLGEPAARKSTSIKMMKRLLSASGYTNFAADKTTKEKFLVDLEGKELDDEEITSPDGSKKKGSYDAITAEALWGTSGEHSEPREVFITADEFNEFSGTGNFDFYTTLGNLWDFDSPEHPFQQRLKNTRSVSIYQPTISILSGNTPVLFARCFPPDAIGSGFLSRLLLIHGERSSRKITWSSSPDQALGKALEAYLQKVGDFTPGEVSLTSGAFKLLDAIYQSDECSVDDVRFIAYTNRRFTQLCKIALIIATGKFQRELTEEDIIQANTILSHAELLMPKAMGEFGKSKHSDVSNKIISFLDTLELPATMKEIFKQVHKDVSMKECTEIVQGLLHAERIQAVTGVLNGFLPKKAPKKSSKFVDWNFLSEEEREMIL